MSWRSQSRRLLIADDRVQTEKDIAEWIGIIGAPSYGLFSFIKWIRGRNLESVTVLKISDGQNMVEIKVEGEAEPIHLTQAVYELYANHQTRQRAVAVLAPLRE